jgi:hypothetical protein
MMMASIGPIPITAQRVLQAGFVSASLPMINCHRDEALVSATVIFEIGR